jgi:nudix-type nucleoside diphosphatase (YffH/AdpP family)
VKYFLETAMRSYKIIREQTVFSAFFDVVEAHVCYQDADGEWTPEVSRLSVERGDAVGIVVYDQEYDAFWFVRQFRYAMVRHSDPYPLEIVAGKIDSGESAGTAARRELSEELGFRIENLESLGDFYSSPGGMSEVVHLYLARVVPQDRADEGANLEDEHLIQELIPRQKVYQMLSDGTLRDGKSIAGLYRAMERLEKL